MVTDEFRSRVEQTIKADPSSASLVALARCMRDEGVAQLTLYRLFTEYYVKAAADDPLCDSIGDTLELIWSGPWAKGYGLFETELTNEDVGRTT